MEAGVTAEQIVQGATDLGKAEFTRKELAEKLDVKPWQLGDGMKAAREAGRIEKAGEDGDGKGIFRLAQ